MNYVKSHSISWICLLLTCQLFSQNITEIKVQDQELIPRSKVSQSIKDAQNAGLVFLPVHVLELSKKQIATSRNKLAKKLQVLEANTSVIQSLIKEAPQQISLSIPKNDRENINLQLIKVNPLAEGFNVFTSANQIVPYNYHPGVYYRGVVEGDEANSVASISVFENEIIGSFTNEGGNMVIQPDYGGSGDLILFNDKDISDQFHYNCFSDQLGIINKSIQSRSTTSAGNCVRVYIECDYSLFQNKGSTTNTVNWMTSVFNNIATLYANESINTVISEVYVWTSADAYSKTSSIDALNQFKTARPTFNGDIAHLAALGGSNLGGVAWVDVLCSNYKYAYSNISSSYSTVPNYSWTIEVMTHEMGHNLGSNHTQWCGWSGGALDNCYTTEGGCPPGPAPNNGGTIMSYCHLTSYGINFNNGFGQQPGDKIRAVVASSSCLNSNCSGGGGGCSPPSGFSVNNITQSSATLNWNLVSDATSYSVDYKTNSGSSWTTVNTSSLSSIITGLSNNTLYNARIKANCASGSSVYSEIINFTTSSGDACGIPINISVTNVSQSAATISWNPVIGASSYNFQYKLASNNTWSQVNLATTTVNLTGMSAGVSYDIRIQSVCGSSLSAFSTIVVITTQSTYCISKGQNTGYEWIKRVNLESIDRVSGPDGGYFNATNLVANLVKGLSYKINYQCGTTGSSGTLYWKVWIDFNNNNSFDDTNELVLSNASSSAGLLSSTFIVPIEALTSNVRMRVSMKYGGYSTSCLAFSYGEVEDYTINIQSPNGGGDVCSSPSSININNISHSTVSANWNAVSEASSYTFEYKPGSESSWSSVNTSSTSFNLSGLNANTLYNCRVKSTCLSGVSDYSTVMNFTTLTQICEIPLNLNVSSITQTNANASWNAVAGVPSYSFEYKSNTESSWTVVNTSTTNYNITGLAPNTLYNTRVKSNCIFGASEYSIMNNFTTLSQGCETPENLVVSNISYTAASLNWNVAPNAKSYSVEYKLNSATNWIAINTTSNNYDLSGLSENTFYDIRIKANCLFGSGNYSATLHFTTLASAKCDVPVNIIASGINQYSAIISWNEVAGAVSYNVQYKLASSGIWTDIAVTNPSVKISALSSESAYEVHVQTICNSNKSEFSSILTFNTLQDYCISKGKSINYEWIKRVNLGTLDRISGKDGGYYNGTNLSTDVVKGSNYVINYQCGTAGSSGTLYWRVWIDFNNNNSFDDPGEMVVSVASPSTGLLSSNFAIPSGSATASVRMRVSMKYGGYSTSCLTYTYGEVEDYMVNILNTGNFVDPNSLKNQIEDVNIYPNPFSNEFNVEFISSHDQNVQLILMDQLGKIYLTESFSALSGRNKFHLKTMQCVPATYLIQIKSSNNCFVRKICKLE